MFKGTYTVVKYRGELIDGEWVPQEVIDVVEQENAIQYRSIEALMRDSPLITEGTARVFISGLPMTNSLNLLMDATNWAAGAIQENPQYTAPILDPVTPVNGFWRVRSRFVPPVAPRYIRSLALGPTSGLAGGVSVAVLNEPIIQEITDVLDVFYRLYIDLMPVVDGKVDANMRKSADFGFGAIMANFNTSFSGMPTSWFYPIQRGMEQVRHDTPGIFNSYSSWRLSSGYGQGRQPSFSSIESCMFGHRLEFPIAGVERDLHHGLLVRSIMVGSDQWRKLFLEPVDKGTTSSVQNSFRRSASAGEYRNPFLDINSLATSQASVSITDAGTWASTVDEIFAHHYRIEITTGGLVGTAEYRLRRRRCTGWNRGSYYPMNTVISTMRPNNNSYTLDMTDDVRHGQSTAQLVQEYLWPEFITFDETGITVMHTNMTFENINADSTQPLNVTGLLQVAAAWDGAPIAKTGDLFVACEDTGLWKVVRPSEGPVTSVTQITPAGITNPNSCRGVSVNSVTGDVWALFHDTTDNILYLGKSTDQGVNWTLYDESTDPQFLLTDYTSGSPGPVNVIALHVSPHSVDNRIFICAPDVFEQTSGSQGFWWSEAGSSPTSDQVRLNYTVSNNVNSMSLTKLKRYASLAVKPLRTTNEWIFRGYENYGAIATFGSTTPTTSISSSRSVMGSRMPIVYEDDSGNEYILGTLKITSTSTPFVPVQDAIVMRTPAQFNTSDYELLLYHPASTSMNVSDDTSSTRTTRSDEVNVRNALTYLICHIGHGIYVSYPGANTINTTAGQYTFISLYGDGTVEAENLHPWFESYGWNGSSWELDHPGSKVTHAGAEALIDTLQISFDDSAGTNALIVNEYYDTYVYDGILLDEATSFKQVVYNFMQATETGTDFTPSVVPAADIGPVVDEPAALLYQGLFDGKIGLNGVYAWGEPGKLTSGSFSASPFTSNPTGYLEHRLTGDFEFRFKLVDSFGTALRIGLIDWSAIEANPYGLTNSSGYRLSFEYNRTGVNNPAGTIQYTINVGVAQFFSTFTNFFTEAAGNENDEFTIRRVGSTITFLVNGVVEYTYGTATAQDLGIAFVATSDQQAGGWTLYDGELDYDVNRRYVKIGNGVSTGADDPNFRRMITDIVTDYELLVELDGSPAVVLTDGVTPPQPGEVNVLPYSGRLWFNAADAGAAITGHWRILKKLNLE